MYRKHYSTLISALVFAAGLPAVAQLQPERTFIVIGPPGSGKTVQANALRKTYKIPAISMSDLLRQEINRKSPLGQSLAASLETGELLGDEPANDVMKARLLRPDAGRGFILDGYPSTDVQAKALDEWLSSHKLPKPIIMILDVPEGVSRERLTKRRHAGDKGDNIERRLRDYREVGRLVEQWYGPERIVRVDGTGMPADVASRIARGIDEAQTGKVLKSRPPKDSGLKQREPERSTPEQKP